MFHANEKQVNRSSKQAPTRAVNICLKMYQINQESCIMKLREERKEMRNCHKTGGAQGWGSVNVIVTISGRFFSFPLARTAAIPCHYK
ncbi:CLUMA_CG014756, isoform A [Clunio marinus]|uniref:CLUMA_CG014756, isoform A n=1 Tax=Clunio marinus TaxID=568069 RepID=A0A1J1IR24_9DIPT|nr:CLUMA_CG014756, isoform A [Clunio marinus]